MARIPFLSPLALFRYQTRQRRYAQMKSFRVRNFPSCSALHLNHNGTQDLDLDATAPTQDCDMDDLFRYTSGRWLWNEDQQFLKRYVKFNMTELIKIATRATGSKSCIEVKKLTEGNFSKVFLMTMDDGTEAIAKLPNPNAGFSRYITASEVATMQFVRDILNIPAPKVYAWNSDPCLEANPVGAEYIIMERSQGIELDQVWDTLPGPGKFEIVQQIASYEKAMTSIEFPMYGSVYFASDLPDIQSHQMIDLSSGENTVGRFAMGPTTNRAFFDDGRNAVNTGRGPWSLLTEYLISRAHREVACVEANEPVCYARRQGFFGGPGHYKPRKDLKLAVLRDYIKVAPHVIPAGKSVSLSKPVLWHGDLHSNNIFVNPSKPTEIVNIIDWQAVNVSPLFLQARHPSLIEFDGSVPEGFTSVKLPENFDSLSAENQAAAKKLLADQSLYKLYEIQLMRLCPDVAAALRFKNSLYGQINGLSSSLSSDGEPIVQGMLIKLQEEWNTHVGLVPCPLSFTEADKIQQKEDEAKWAEGVELMEDFLDKVGVYRGWDGWVNHDSYEAMKERLRYCTQEFLDRHAKTPEEREQWMENWPFRDG